MNIKLHYTYTMLLLAAIFMVPAYAQDSEYFRQHYYQGKTLLDEKKPALALEALKPVLQQNDANPYRPNAICLYASAALQTKRPQEAHDVLVNFLENNTHPEIVDDASYLLADAHFRLSKPEKGVDRIFKITKPEIKAQADQMAYFYLSTDCPLSVLSRIYEKHPEWPPVMKALKKHSLAEAMTEQERTALARAYSGASGSGEAGWPVEKKKTYNVSVLLPFLLSREEELSGQQSNAFILHYTEGIRAAVDSLKSIGIELTLRFYDIPNDTLKFNNLLKTGRLAESDIMIGPVYLPMIRKLSAKYPNIPVLVPFIKLAAADTVSMPEVYFTEQSYELTGVMAAEHALKIAEADIATVLYEDTEKDSLIAAGFIREYEAGGGKIRGVTKISGQRVEHTLQALNIPFKDTLAGMIFVSVTNTLTAGTVIQGIEANNYRIPIVGGSDWLYFNSISTSQLENRKFNILYPDYINHANEAVVDFKKDFTSAVGVYPSVYAYQGFSLMYEMGKLFEKYGKYIHPGLRTDECENFLFGGYDFSRAKSNAFAPVYILRSGVPVRYVPSATDNSEE